MKVSVLNHGLAYVPKRNHARWEQDRQELLRRRRLAEVRGVVQSRRPPRPGGPMQREGISRVPSLDGGSRPSSQCSTPKLYKPRARSASPQKRLEPLERRPPQGPPLRQGGVPQSPERRGRELPIGSTPVRPAYMISPGQRRKDLEKLVSPGSPGSAAVRAEMQDWYFAENGRQRGTTGLADDPTRNKRDLNRLGKPRLPPMPPDGDHRALGQRRRAHSEGGPRIRHPDRSTVLGGMPIAPVSGHNMESVPSLGARASPKQAKLEAIAVSATSASNGASPSKSSQPPLLPAVQPALVPLPELNSAGAIQDWLAQAQQRLVGLVPGVVPAENATKPVDEEPGAAPAVSGQTETGEGSAGTAERNAEAAREGEPLRVATPCSMPRTPGMKGMLGGSSRSCTPDSRSHGSATPCNGTQSPLEAKEVETTAATTALEEDHAEKAPAASQEASLKASVRCSSAGVDGTTTVRTPNSNRSRTTDSCGHSNSRVSSFHSSRSSVAPHNSIRSLSEAKDLVGAATLELAAVDAGTESAASKAASPVASARRRSNGLRGTATLRSSMGMTTGSYADDFEEFAAEGDDSEGESEEEDGEDDDSEVASLEGTQ